MLWFSSSALLHLLPMSRPSSLAHTKTCISCSHQEHHGLDAGSQVKLNPIPTLSMGLHPPALLSWAVIIYLPLGFFLFLPFETESLLPFESAWSSCSPNKDANSIGLDEPRCSAEKDEGEEAEISTRLSPPTRSHSPTAKGR